MSKELELYKEFLNIIEFPVKSHLLNSNDKPTLERYRVLRTQIEDSLEENSELKTRNYELLKESELWYNQRNKFKQALKIIKEKEVNVYFLRVCMQDFSNNDELGREEYNKQEGSYWHTANALTQEEYDLLKEVLGGMDDELK